MYKKKGYNAVDFNDILGKSMKRPQKMQSSLHVRSALAGWAPLASLLALLVFTGCGADRDIFGKPKKKSETPSAAPEKPKAIPQSPEEIEFSQALERSLPVETFLLGMRELPTRLKATTVLLRFRSNMSKATFECRTAAGSPWEPCPLGDKFRIAQLKHGQTIALWVRAKGQDGRIDTSPLMLGTLIDLQDGVTVSNAIEEAQDQSPLVKADQLPAEMDREPQGGATIVAERKVLVGSYYGVVVPWQMYVATYSTSKTYNASLQILRVLGRNAGTAYDGERCDRDFERIVQGPRGLQYCEATPGRAQLEETYAKPMPYNHVELVFAKDFGEKIMVAAFDQDTDPLESRLGIDHVCSGAPSSGTQAVPVLNEFFGVEPAREMLTWCQVRAANGSFWWVGGISALLNGNPDSPRIKIIYSVNADRGILSGQQFAGRAASMLTKVIVPIAAVPE